MELDEALAEEEPSMVYLRRFDTGSVFHVLLLVLSLVIGPVWMGIIRSFPM